MNDKVFYQIMLFYSVLTFFVGPNVSKIMKLGNKDPCMIGMIVGFVVSLVLWKNFGYNMVYKGKSSY